MHRRLMVIYSVFCALIAASLPLTPALAAWASERDPGLGFTYSYPTEVFDRLEGDGKPSFHYFASGDSEAKFLVGAWNNSAGQSPQSLKSWMMENVGGYDELTYRPRGRSWFVLSGYRDDKIYYEKVMFSCRDELVTVLAITYPVNERETYDPIVERMENAFKPSSCA